MYLILWAPSYIHTIVFYSKYCLILQQLFYTQTTDFREYSHNFFLTKKLLYYLFIKAFKLSQICWNFILHSNIPVKLNRCSSLFPFLFVLLCQFKVGGNNNHDNLLLNILVSRFCLALVFTRFIKKCSQIWVCVFMVMSENIRECV